MQASNKSIVQTLLPNVARQAAMGSKLDDIEGSVIYPVTEHWEAEEIGNDKAVVVVSTFFELEAAVKNPEMATIFVPKKSAITMEVLKNVIGRSGLLKTIFWEM